MSPIVKITVAAIAILTVGGAVATAGTPDQSQPYGDFTQAVGDGNPNSFQTVTPGITGLLDEVELAVQYNDECANPRFNFEVRTVTGSNLPANRVLGDGVVTGLPGPGSGAQFTVANLSHPVGVSEGRQLAIVSAIKGSCGYSWWAGFDDAYEPGRFGSQNSGGDWFAYDGGDLAFKTEVRKGRCDGVDATLAGQVGADTVNGSENADVIQSYGGDDKANGAGGADTICGSAGDDVIKGDAGKDVLIGGRGKDRCVGGPGKDKAIDCEQKIGI